MTFVNYVNITLRMKFSVLDDIFVLFIDFIQIHPDCIEPFVDNLHILMEQFTEIMFNYLETEFFSTFLGISLKVAQNIHTKRSFEFQNSNFPEDSLFVKSIGILDNLCIFSFEEFQIKDLSNVKPKVKSFMEENHEVLISLTLEIQTISPFLL